MTRQPDFVERLEEYLDEFEGQTPLPDATRDAIRAQLPSIHQRPAWWPGWRLPDINKSTMLAMGAAAVVVVALIGFTYFGGGRGIGDSPSSPSEAASTVPTPTAAPTPVVSGSLPGGGDIIEGTYIVSDPFRVEMGLELGPGWSMWGGGVGSDVVAMYKGSPDPPAGHGIIFVIVNNTYADPCDKAAGYTSPQVGPSVDDLASALVAQASTESSDPVAVSIDGYDGVFLDYRNTGEDCGTIARWPSARGDRIALPGERDQVWILDVDGTRLVIDAFSFSGTTQSDLDEMRRVVEELDLSPASG
jgi:hypothetical protein